jgi:hypothetical protein
MASNWLAYIRGYTDLLLPDATAVPSRKQIRFLGFGLTDDNTRSILNKYPAAQVITGSGTWDQRTDRIQVKGSGARVITIPDPLDPVVGQELLITDANGSAGAGNITVDPSGTNSLDGAASGTTIITTNWQSRRLQWLGTGAWVRIQG